ncbi:MAG: hypothetical protein AB7J40_00595 [Candidatus Altimarinota bacterium]
MKNEEHIIFNIDDHWVVLIRPLLFLLLGWVLFAVVFLSADLALSVSPLVRSILHLLGFIMLVVVHHFFFVMLLQWKISGLTLTNKRIIDVRFIPLIKDDIVHIDISKINKIEKRKHGLIRNLLNYGVVQVELTNTQGVIELENVPNPSKFVNRVEALKNSGRFI